MTFDSILKLFGGLALFLYGMHMMSSGLEGAAGDRMKTILERLTSNRFLGIIVGAAITAVIQSSSATTVMVVGFVNSQLMTLNQAVWIIMGANIGTTITGQLILRCCTGHVSQRQEGQCLRRDLCRSWYLIHRYGYDEGCHGSVTAK